MGNYESVGQSMSQSAGGQDLTIRPTTDRQSNQSQRLETQNVLPRNLERVSPEEIYNRYIELLEEAQSNRPTTNVYPRDLRALQEERRHVNLLAEADSQWHALHTTNRLPKTTALNKEKLVPKQQVPSKVDSKQGPHFKRVPKQQVPSKVDSKQGLPFKHRVDKVDPKQQIQIEVDPYLPLSFKLVHKQQVASKVDPKQQLSFKKGIEGMKELKVDQNHKNKVKKPGENQETENVPVNSARESFTIYEITKEESAEMSMQAEELLLPYKLNDRTPKVGNVQNGGENLVKKSDTRGRRGNKANWRQQHDESETAELSNVAGNSKYGWRNRQNEENVTSESGNEGGNRRFERRAQKNWRTGEVLRSEESASKANQRNNCGVTLKRGNAKPPSALSIESLSYIDLLDGFLNDSESLKMSVPSLEGGDFSSSLQTFKAALNAFTVAKDSKDQVIDQLNALQELINIKMKFLTDSVTDKVENWMGRGDSVSEAGSLSSVASVANRTREYCQFCQEPQTDLIRLVVHLETCAKFRYRDFQQKPKTDLSYFQILPNGRVKCNLCTVTLRSLGDKLKHGRTPQHVERAAERELLAEINHGGNKRNNTQVATTDFVFCSCCKMLVPDSFTGFHLHVISPEHAENVSATPSNTVLVSKGVLFSVNQRSTITCLVCTYVFKSFDTNVFLEHINSAEHKGNVKRRQIEITDGMNFLCNPCETQLTIFEVEMHLKSPTHVAAAKKAQRTEHPAPFIHCLFCSKKHDGLKELAIHAEDCRALANKRKSIPRSQFSTTTEAPVVAEVKPPLLPTPTAVDFSMFESLRRKDSVVETPGGVKKLGEAQTPLKPAAVIKIETKQPNNNTDFYFDATAKLTPDCSAFFSSKPKVQALAEALVESSSADAALDTTLIASIISLLEASSHELLGSRAASLSLPDSPLSLCLSFPSPTPTFHQYPPYLNSMTQAVFTKLRQANQFADVVKMADVLGVRCVHVDTGRSCRIVVQTKWEKDYALVLREFVGLDPRVRPFLLLVKFWATDNELLGEEEGQPDLAHLSDHALNVMALFFLQHLGVLPRLALPPLVLPLNLRPTDANVEGTAADLLMGFLSFVSQFDFRSHAVSLAQPHPVPRSDSSGPKQVHSCVLCPVQEGRNLTSTLRLELLRRFSTLARLTIGV